MRNVCDICTERPPTRTDGVFNIGACGVEMICHFSGYEGHVAVCTDCMDRLRAHQRDGCAICDGPTTIDFGGQHVLAFQWKSSIDSVPMCEECKSTIDEHVLSAPEPDFVTNDAIPPDESNPHWFRRDHGRYVVERTAYLTRATNLPEERAAVLAWAELGYTHSGIAKRVEQDEPTVRGYLDDIEARYGASTASYTPFDERAIDAPLKRSDGTNGGTRGE